MTMPEFTFRSAPVIARAASEARNTATSATSRASVSRLSAAWVANSVPDDLHVDAPFLGLRLAEPIEPRAGDEARRDEVDANAVRPGLERQRPGQAEKRHLGRGVGGSADQRAFAADRPDVDHRPGAARDHRRQHGTGHQEHPGDVDIERLLPVGEIDLPQRSRRAADGAVVDQYVDVAESVEDGLRHGLDARRLRYIGRNHEGLPTGGSHHRCGLLQVGLVTGRQYDDVPLFTEGGGDLTADALAGPGDDDDVSHRDTPGCRRSTRG